MSGTFKVVIDTGNDAFREGGGAEVHRILSEIAATVDEIDRQPIDRKSILDANGNRVGWWEWKQREENDT
jgi:hypothetical protein